MRYCGSWLAVFNEAANEKRRSGGAGRRLASLKANLYGLAYYVLPVMRINLRKEGFYEQKN
jgi:hypothetical protein